MNEEQNLINMLIKELDDVIKGVKDWTVAWEIAKIAKEKQLIDLCDKACAVVLLRNPEFWYARELPKHARGYYGQNLQDTVIEQYINEQGVKSKFFVEVGAFDGVNYSNVRRLVEKYGWKGICIEPVEKNYNKLCESYKGTDIICVRSAVSDFSGTMEINVSTYPHLPDWGSDVASLGGEDMHKWTERYGAIWEKETVSVRTLNEILTQYHINEIGFISIDAEGHDLEVLKGIDLNKYKPELIIVEFGDEKNEIIDYITRFNYSLMLDDGQDLFLARIKTNGKIQESLNIETDHYPEQLMEETTLAINENDGENNIRDFSINILSNEINSIGFDEISNKINPFLFASNILSEQLFCRVDKVKPIQLLCPERFDILVKYIFGNFLINNLKTDFAEKIYKSHLFAFNKFREGDFSNKSSYEDFLKNFKSLLKSIQLVGFNENQSVIPVDKNNIAIDGSHRIAICLLFGIDIPVAVFHFEANIYDYKYFLNRGFDRKYADYIAYSYVKVKKNTHIVCLFPSAVGYDDEVEDILKECSKIVYGKEIEINSNGAVNLMKQMYRDEKWLGNEFNNFEGARYKASKCYQREGLTRVYLIETDNPASLVQAKEKIRNIYRIENHSVHINDRYDETLRLAQIYFNENSINFINNALVVQPPRFNHLFQEYRKFLVGNNVDLEYFCVDGSAVMSAYGIRDCRDMDYLQKGYEEIVYKDIEIIGSHNSEIHHHTNDIDEIIFNPENHFYYNGLKFCSLEEIRNMKRKRGEQKDFEDVDLIDKKRGAESKANELVANTEIKGKKIVGLVPGRNERIQIAQCLQCLSKFTDAIVYLDDCSDDDTLEIVHSLREECNIEKIIEKKEWIRNEPKDRNDLLNAGREIGGTHFIVLDADEIITSNLLFNNLLKNAILNLQHSDIIKLNWIQLWRSTEQYRFDNSVWTYNYKDFIFCDDGKCYYSSDFIHTSRCPGNLNGRVFTLEGYGAGVMHFQFVNWRNLLIKQAWYRCLERIKEPNKDIEKINTLYAPSKDETGLNLAPVKEEWFSYYDNFDKSIYNLTEHWREKQIINWFNKYGKEFFKELDIWDIDWNEDILKLDNTSGEILVSAIVSVYKAEKFIEGCLEDLVNQTLFKQGKLEIVIVDSNSPENEFEIIKKYLEKHKNIIYHRTKERETVYQAWNRGIKLSRGKYLTNANTDDRHRPDALEIMANYLEEHLDIGVVYADCYVTELDNPIWNYDYQKALKWPDFDLRHLFDVCFLGPQPLWRKCLHDKYGYFDEEYISAGDYEFWLRLIVNGVKMHHINQILGIYQENKNSISLSNLNLNWQESQRARVKHWPESWGLKPVTKWQSYERIISEQKLRRILIVCDYFWPSIGGVEIFAEDLAVSFIERGYIVEIACRKLTKRQEFVYKGVKINQFEGDNSNNKIVREIDRNRFIHLCSRTNFDIAIAISQPDNWIGEYLKATFDKPYLIYLPSINYDNFVRWQKNGYFPELVERLSIADKLIAVSENGWDAKFLKQMNLDFEFIPHGTIQNDAKIDFKAEFGISTNKPMILLVANFWTVKNHIGLFNEFKKLKFDCELVVIGNKLVEFENYYNTCINEAGTDPRIIILGGLEREITSTAIRDADLLVVPSLGESAGPLVVLQAMSYGTPWLATTYCNSVMDEAGGIVTDLESFNEVITVLFSNPGALNKLGILGIEHWQRCFQWDKMIEAFIQIIENGRNNLDFRMPNDIREKSNQLREEILNRTSIKNKENPIHFSVIIPTYNRSDVLIKCIEALNNQTYPSDKFEVIVVDDGSTDDSEIKVKNFVSNYHLKYIKQSNSGPGAARNKGILEAKGEYVLILNDDAICNPDLLSEHSKVHNSLPNEKISVLGDFPYIEEAQKKPFVYFLENSSLVFAYPIMEAGRRYNYRFFWTCNLSIRKQVIIEAGMFDEEFREPMVEDTELGYRLQKMGYSVFYHPNALAVHYHSMDINGFAKRQKMSGRNVVLLFKKHPELLETEKQLFGFDNLGYENQLQFKALIAQNKSAIEKITQFLLELDKVSSNDLDKVRLPDGKSLTKQEMVKFMEKLAFTVHQYWFHIGLLEGIEKYGVPGEQEKQINSKADIKINQRKRILFTMYGWNESGGGTIIPKSIAIRLARKGYEVAVFYAGLLHPENKNPYFFEKINDSGVVLYGVYNRPAIFTNGANPESEIRDEKIVELFTRVLDEFQPDIVHYHNFIGLSFAIADLTKSKGIPTVFTPHNYHLMDPNLYMIEQDLQIWKTVSLIENSALINTYSHKRELYIQRMIEARKLLNERIDITLAISHRVKELLIDFGANPSRIAVVNQVPESVEHLTNLKTHFNPSLPLRAGFIGTVIPHKGVHIIASAAQIIPSQKMNFYIYGFGNQKYIEVIKNFDKMNRLNWMGEYRPQDLPNISGNLDFVIIPSVWEEGAGMVLPESLAMGLPVVAADIGGIPDYIKKGVNGALYKYNSAFELANILNEIADKPEKLIEWQKSCNLPYSFDEFVDWLIQIYSELLSDKIINCEDLSLYFDKQIQIESFAG